MVTCCSRRVSRSGAISVVCAHSPSALRSRNARLASGCLREGQLCVASVGRRVVLRIAAAAALAGSFAAPAPGLTVQGPNLNASLLRITTFAEDLNYPVGMAALDDGSILAAVTNGASFFGSTSGSLVRLADTDDDGVVDEQQTLVADVPGGKISALRRAGPLLAVTGQGAGTPISLYRLGASPTAAPTYLGGIELTYPSGGWLHPHSALALRRHPTDADRYELYFQLGSDTNFAETTRTVALGGSLGLTGSLAGDAVHRIELFDGPAGLTATGRTQIATGLRNATGIAFHPVTGDLYLGDNGIDGVVNVNEPTSADEINVVPAGVLGTTIVDFGFPNTYEAYRTGVTVGGAGVLPLATFQPLPPPNGAEAEGVNEIVFAPPLFPEPLVNGLFAGFHGRFNLAGDANEENPLALVDLDDMSQFHFVPNTDPTVGHLDGLLATTDTLYVADISTHGAFSGSAQNSGKIYAIKSLIPRGDYDRDGDADGADLLQWQRQLGATMAAFAGADGDGSRLVDDGDLLVWSAEFGAGGAAGSQREVAEPRSAALAGMGVLVACGWRRSSRRDRQTLRDRPRRGRRRCGGPS